MWWLRFITTYLMLLRAARGLAVRRARAPLLSARAPLPRRFASPRASTILFSRAAEAAAAAAASVVEVEEGASRRSLPSKLRKEVAFRQKYECAACGCLLPPDHEVDHVVPVALNGSDSLENLQALCRPCHLQKTRDQRHAILDAKRMPGAAAAPRPAPPRAPPVTLNAQLLGGKISFFQSVCVLGYCIFPLNVASVLCFFVSHWLFRVVVGVEADAETC